MDKCDEINGADRAFMSWSLCRRGSALRCGDWALQKDNALKTQAGMRAIELMCRITESPRGN